MRDLGKALEHAESLTELAWSQPGRLHTQSSADSKRKPLLPRLLDVYLEESKKEAHTKKLRCASHLLDKLVKRDFLNTLVVNLYPGNEGYSLMIKGRNGCNSETIKLPYEVSRLPYEVSKLPYEEVELLEYIDAEELPPLLVDLLDKLSLNVFYSGCVIIELRDYRRTTDGTFDSQHILLRPTSHKGEYFLMQHTGRIFRDATHTMNTS
ncbi:Transcription factor SPT20-like [Lamellibrachia satsuma]|nr:Transcription factor SPT20-like [Lamellibrachia satsuma]